MHPVACRLREYVYQSKHLRMAEAQRTLMQAMPPSLKGETMWATNQSWLQKIWFLKSAPRAFMVELALSLTAMVFAPGDTPRIGFMYIVHRGVALYRAKLVTKGRVFGEDMILNSPHLRSNAQAKAMNYLEVYHTSRRELLIVAQRFPKTLAAIRRAAVMLALRRHIIYVARKKMGVGNNDGGQVLSELARLRKLQEQGGDQGARATKELEATRRRSLIKSKTLGLADIAAAMSDESTLLDELPVDMDARHAPKVSLTLAKSGPMDSGSFNGSGGGSFSGGGGGMGSGAMGGMGGDAQDMLVEEMVGRVIIAHEQTMLRFQTEMRAELLAAQEQQNQKTRELMAVMEGLTAKFDGMTRVRKHREGETRHSLESKSRPPRQHRPADSGGGTAGSGSTGSVVTQGSLAAPAASQIYLTA